MYLKILAQLRWFQNPSTKGLHMVQISSQFWTRLGYGIGKQLHRLWPTEVVPIHKLARARHEANAANAAVTQERIRRVAKEAEVASLLEMMRDNTKTHSVQTASLFEHKRIVALLESELRRVEEERDFLLGLSATDPLTGLANRRGLVSATEKEVSLLCHSIGNKKLVPKTYARPKMTALAFDLDNFKKINDIHGHHVGDSIIVAFASLLLTYFGHRPSDTVCRLGGDEFLVIMPQADGRHAHRQAECLLKAMRADARFHIGQRSVTASIGIAQVLIELGSVPDTVLSELMKKADDALYEAKNNGRNSISMADDVTQWGGLEA